MKKTIRIIAMLMACCFIITTTQCNKAGSDGKDSLNKEIKSGQARNPNCPLPNIRYIDMDSIQSKYHLCKDYEDELSRMRSTLESTYKQRESAMNSFLGQMQQKMQNNGYLSEQAFNADQQKAAQMQANAQNELAKLQNDIAKCEADAYKAIEDSIKSYLEYYNASHHYDMILYKHVAPYVNPDLDITDEVIDGLNKRYNKIKK